MAGFKRARSRDRDAATELINTAYADGQLDAGERDSRVHRALVARTLDDLKRLTVDLQGDQAPAPPTPLRRRVGAIGAALVLGGVGIGIAVSAGTDDEPVSSVGSPEQDYVVPVTAQAVTALVADYEREFGTTRTFGFNLNRQISQVRVPTGDGHARYRTFLVVNEGTYAESEDVRGARDMREFDLADLDLAALAVTLERAHATLGVEDPTWAILSLSHWDHADAPTATVNVGNDYEESGYLVTDVAGEVIEERPYAPAGTGTR